MPRAGKKRFIITSTWGQHFVEADSEYDAEEIIEDEFPGYPVLDGMTEEWDRVLHGKWEG